MVNRKIVLFIVLFIRDIIGKIVPLCKGIEYSNSLIDCLSNVPVYTYYFDLNVELNNNGSFPNKLIFSNFSHWSLNDSIYFHNEAISIWYLQNLIYSCSNMEENCEVEFPNGRGYHSYPLTSNGTKMDIISRMQLVFDDGFIYSLSDQSSYNLFDGKCYKKNYPPECNKDTTFINFETACCNNFVDIEIPDKNEDICEEYENKAKFMNALNPNIFSFFATHTLTSNGLNVTVKNFTAAYPNSKYKYGPDWYNCQNNETFSTSKCFITFPIDDFYYNLIIQIISQQNIYEALLGRFIRRKGIYLKYGNMPYTKEEPCRNQTTFLIASNGTTVESSLCCTKFRGIEFTQNSIKEYNASIVNNVLLRYAFIFLGCLIFVVVGYCIWECCKISRSKKIVPAKNEDSVSSFCDILIKSTNIFIIFNKILGKGSTCTVYPVKIKNSKNSNSTKFVIKIPTLYDSSHLEEIMHELSIIKRLEKQHPSICLPIFWTFHQQIPCIIFEKMDTNLLLFVKNYSEAKFPPKKLFLQILWQISNGLEFIASKNVIHRDIAARNILITSPNIAKISDFGLWCECNNDSLIYFSTFRKKLPYKWLSIEALKDKIFSEKSDVWSFGILMYEMWSKGKMPYIEKEIDELIEFLSAGNRLEIPVTMTDDNATIMNSCWFKLKEERPNFQTIKANVSKILDNLRSDDYSNLQT